MFQLTLAIFVTFLSMIASGQDLETEQECERTLPDGTTQYLACMGTTEPLYLLQIEPMIEPEFATCGLEDVLDRSLYCTLDISFRCNICNASNETIAHPPEYMVDPEPLEGALTWWQSISWYDYPLPLDISVTLPLNHTYKLNDDITLTFQSGRPQYMVLEKSMDHGATWEVYQYYARDCEDLNMTASFRPTSSTEVICVEDYSSSLPDPDISFRCNICNASNETIAHPPEYMVDPEPLEGALTWWQSISWYDYPLPLDISVTLPLNHTYKLNDDITLTFQSGRPQYMVLEKSMDHGATWEVYQYYARDCEDLNMTASFRPTSSTEVICVEDYSSSLPRSGGIVEFDIASRYELFSEDMTPALMYEALENDTEFLNFLTLTDLRVSLLYPATDGLEISGQSLNLLKYYYAISDIDVFLLCDCNLHGAYCRDTAEGVACDCRHNTMGLGCEQCLPLYNNRLWRRGSQVPYPLGTANECQKCDCNGHATSCTYNTTLEHGVCNDCTHNTSGLSCDVCVPGFYPDVDVPIDSENRCVQCDCNHLGTDSSVCSQLAVDALPAGQCSCRANVTGRSCERCVDGYYGLARLGSCQACSCNTLGTVNGSISCHQDTGQCFCKPSITGRSCDQCEESFFQYPSSLNEECLPCGCDPGGSLSLVCHNETGTCQCRDHLSGARCFLVDTNYFVPSLDYHTFDAWSASSSCQQLVDADRGDVSGQGYHRCYSFDVITFDNITVATSIPREYRLVVEYTYLGLVPPMEINLTFAVSQNASNTSSCPYLQQEVIHSVSGVTFDPGLGQAWIDVPDVPLSVHPSCVHEAQLTLGVVIEGGVDVDSLVLLPVPDNATVFQQADEGDRVIFEECLRTSVSDDQLSDTCTDFGSSVMAEIFDGALECGCDLSGSLSLFCSGGGGQCFCRPGVGGRRCDYCLQGYYSFSPLGCTACDCNGTYAIGGGCDYSTGQCFCRDGVALAGEENILGLPNDLQCNSCLLDHHRTGEGCAPCDCNINGSLSMQCDLHGACTCKEMISGDVCDRCLPGYYNFSAEGCIPCDCSEAGSTAEHCHAEDGTCACKEQVVGSKCDQCSPGTFNLQWGNPRGCQECFCYGHATECESAPNIVRSRIVTNFGGNSLDGWTVLDSTSLDLNPSNLRVSQPPNRPNQFVYLQAPAKFLGDRIKSYSLSFHVSMKLDTGTVSQPGAPILRVVGGASNHTMIYSDEMFLPTNRVTDVTAAFYEDLWLLEDADRSPTRREFFDILSAISTLEVRASFGVDTVSTFYSVIMEDAGYTETPLFSDELVYSVELCNCSDNTAGLSCESCITGTFREDLDSGQDAGCTPCECSGRAQSCDPDTGLCLDCLPGTSGDNCEACAPNVQEPGCLQCLPNHYGYGTDLFNGGCVACGCNITGTVIETTDCRNEDGQCFCRPNYGGRQCDRCSLNHNGAECLPCDVCYDFVLELYTASEVEELQSQIFLDGTVNDTSPSSFYRRYDLSREQVLVLIGEITEVENEINSFQDAASELNATMIALMGQLEAAEDILDDESNQTTIQGNVDAAHGIIENVTSDLQEAYEILNNGELVRLTDELTELTNQLSVYEGQLSLLAVQGSGKVESLESQVARIRNTTQRAMGASAMALQTVLTAQAIHDEVTTRLANILTDSTTAGNLISTLGEEAARLKQGANSTLLALQSFTSTSDNVTRLEERLVRIWSSYEDIIDRVGDTSAQIDTQLAYQQSLTDEVNSALNITSQLRGESSALDVSDLADRAESANRRAASALTSSNQLFAQAGIQLEVVQDFQNISTSSQESASAASQESLGITTVAQEAFSLAQQQRESLSTAAMCAAEGLANASLVAQIMQEHQADVLALNKHVEDLQARQAQAGWNESKADVVKTINDTVLQPAVEQCNTDRMAIDTLEATATGVESRAQEVTTETLGLVQEVDSLMQQLVAINELDLSQLESLQFRVTQISSRLTQAQYEEAVGLLRGALDEQNAWIEAVTMEINSLQSQINALESFRVD